MAEETFEGFVARERERLQGEREAILPSGKCSNLNLLRAEPHWREARSGILERKGLKGDKAREISVSNALTALTKSAQVMRDGQKWAP